ncbi:MAG: MBL fold metallo-hydrolase [Gammaproteobacteria bacterium]|nr:MBL fold metallo-hydrolase [Gammaproteobacteria bacterium]MDE0270182.1 MBL fold metallo-hydrolase [Gammaproteobacteria bacterium]
MKAVDSRTTPSRRLLHAGLLAVSAATSGAFAAEDPFSGVEVAAVHVSGAVHMLTTGVGGNIAVTVGDDGVLIVDDQFLPLAERIQNAIDEIGGGRPGFVLNTHYHGDHVGGNRHFGEAAVIVAHSNVRTRLAADEKVVPVALPVVTFDEALSIHFNGDDIAVFHLPAGHTDGDSAVWFKSSNVLHLGDQLFSGRFPYIDLEAGGTVQGYIANLESVIKSAPADVKVIPGHGPLTNIDGVRQAAAVIRATRDTVARAIAEGMKVDAIIEAGLGDEYAEWGSGFINEENWIRILAMDIAQRGH